MKFNAYLRRLTNNLKVDRDGVPEAELSVVLSTQGAPEIIAELARFNANEPLVVTVETLQSDIFGGK